MIYTDFLLSKIINVMHSKHNSNFGFPCTHNNLTCNISTNFTNSLGFLQIYFIDNALYHLNE